MSMTAGGAGARPGALSHIRICDLTGYTYPGLPFTGEMIPQTIRRAPLVGEHNDEVMAELREADQAVRVVDPA
jgi:hypothetical protein